MCSTGEPHRMHRPRRLLVEAASVIILIAVLLFVLMPLIWMVFASFKPAAELVSGQPHVFPTQWSVESYRRLSKSDFLLYLENSLIVAGFSSVLATGIGALTAYAMARIPGGWTTMLSGLSLFAYMLAPIMLVIPFFVILRWMGLGNSRTGLVLAHLSFCLPFAIWTLYAFFLSLPLELEDRAAADGLGPGQVFLRIVLPLSLPGLLTTALFCFILSWNEYVFARVLISRESLKTLPVGIDDMFFASYVDWGRVMAAGVIMLIPAMFMVILAQRQLRQGWLQGWQ